MDEHALSWPDLRVVPKPLERGEPRDVDVAACSNDSAGGFSRSPSSRALTYSAKVAGALPNTSSPALKRVTFGPTASTGPAMSTPRTGSSRCRVTFPMISRSSPPWVVCQSSALTDAARIRTSTRPSASLGLGTIPHVKVVRGAGPFLHQRLHRVAVVGGLASHLPHSCRSSHLSSPSRFRCTPIGAIRCKIPYIVRLSSPNWLGRIDSADESSGLAAGFRPRHPLAGAARSCRCAARCRRG